MRVLVCGGRNYSDRLFLFDVLDRIHARCPITTIIEGGATGADRIARSWANKNHIEVFTYPANWELHGHRAGPVRNAKMLREGRPDLVVAFKGGRGTTHMVSIAGEAGVRLLLAWKYKDCASQSPLPN